MLARREHSQHELKQKLLSRFKDNPNEIETILAQLILDNYQSDQRFCAAFIRYRQQKAYGRIRITSELRQKGIDSELINQSFIEEDVDWFELALRLKISKFGEQVTKDYSSKSKQYRYLQYRGFSTDQINYAIQEDIHDKNH
jgi:regulatory protein